MTVAVFRPRVAPDVVLTDLQTNLAPGTISVDARGTGITVQNGSTPLCASVTDGARAVSVAHSPLSVGVAGADVTISMRQAALSTGVTPTGLTVNQALSRVSVSKTQDNKTVNNSGTTLLAAVRRGNA